MSNSNLKQTSFNSHFKANLLISKRSQYYLQLDLWVFRTINNAIVALCMYEFVNHIQLPH